MIHKFIARGRRKCKNCSDIIKTGEECFETQGSGLYHHTICKKCVVTEVNK